MHAKETLLTSQELTLTQCYKYTIINTFLDFSFNRRNNPSVLLTSQDKGLGPKEVRWVCSRSYIQQETESPWPAGPRSGTHRPRLAEVLCSLLSVAF